MHKLLIISVDLETVDFRWWKPHSLNLTWILKYFLISDSQSSFNGEMNLQNVQYRIQFTEPVPWYCFHLKSITAIYKTKKHIKLWHFRFNEFHTIDWCDINATNNYHANKNAFTKNATHLSCPYQNTVKSFRKQYNKWSNRII